MVVTTTGSTVLGAVQGTKRELNASGAGVVDTITFVNGTPDQVVTSVTGSDIAYDPTGAQYYMSQVIGGSSWINIGSVS